MVKLHYASTKINPIHKKVTTFKQSQKSHQKIQRRFNEKYVSSRSKKSQLGRIIKFYSIRITFWTKTSCMVGEKEWHRPFVRNLQIWLCKLCHYTLSKIIWILGALKGSSISRFPCCG